MKEAVTFQVISAQQLPKPEWDKPSSIVDPQVWVEIYGVPIDNMKKKTHHIENNGKCLLLGFKVFKSKLFVLSVVLSKFLSSRRVSPLQI